MHLYVNEFILYPSYYTISFVIGEMKYVFNEKCHCEPRIISVSSLIEMSMIIYKLISLIWHDVFPQDNLKLLDSLVISGKPVVVDVVCMVGWVGPTSLNKGFGAIVHNDNLRAFSLTANETGSTVYQELIMEYPWQYYGGLAPAHLSVLLNIGRGIGT